MHFRSQNNYSNENIESIVSCFRKTSKTIDSVIVVVSGDLTFDGDAKQSEEIVSFFIALKERIVKEYPIPEVYVLMVPGNHDVDHTNGIIDALKLNEIARTNAFEKELQVQKQKIKNAIDACRIFGCFCGTDSLVDTRSIIIESNGKKASIQCNLINTAPFSAKEDEDKGFHYLPSEDIDKLADLGEAEFVFTIMHHPHQFFNWETLTKIEEVLIQNSDLIFVGHEHYSKIIGMESKNSNVQIFSGGKLCNAGNWSISEFYIGILDTDIREFSIDKYQWSIDNRIYIGEHMNKYILGASSINGIGISIDPKAYHEVMMDSKYMISDNLLNYFVFPLLEKQPKNQKTDGKEISSLEDFICELSEKRKAIVLGQSGYGKTSMAKILFNHFLSSSATILIEGVAFRDHRFERTIRYRFEELYSDRPADWERFAQSDKCHKVIIIDNAELINESLIEELLVYLDGQFGTIIQFEQSDIEFNIFERIKRREVTSQYEYYRIRSFYQDRREKLIRNIVRILVNQGEDAQQRIAVRISDSLKMHRNIFSWSPDGIVQYAKYACNNIGDSLRNDGDTFSKVFEMNLTSLLNPYSGQIKVDKVFFVLDKIAYAVHIMPNSPDKYPMTSENISYIIRDYNEVYDEDIEPVEFINLMLKANIFRRSGRGYVFSESSYLAYFIAREMKRVLTKGDFTEFQKCLDYACFGINAEIVLFLTYIVDNPLIITRIMDKATEYVYRWEELTLSPINIPYLSDVGGIVAQPVADEDRETDQRMVIEQEREAERQSKDIDQSAIYTYNESDLRLADEMVRSVSIMIILSRTLPSFEHIMEAPDKKRCVELVYMLPLRIFHMWANSIENSKSEIVADIKKMLELRNYNEFDKRRAKYVSIEDAVSLLRVESISLLLELLNTSMSNATRSDTLKYLDAFAYGEKMTYRIQHLMSLDRRDNPTAFKRESVEVFEDCREYIEQLLVKNVARHYMVTSKKLDRSGRQYLNSKLFGDELDQQKLIADVIKNERRDHV